MKIRSARSTYGSFAAGPAGFFSAGAFMSSTVYVEILRQGSLDSGGEEAQPLGERAQHRLGEAGAHFHQRQEGGAADRQQGAVGLGERRGEARRLLDQRRLAEYSARAELLHHLVADLHRDPAFGDDVHAQARLTRLHDRLVAVEVDRHFVRQAVQQLRQVLRIERHRFLGGGLGRERTGGLERLDRLAQPPDHDAHQHQREAGLPAQRRLELLVVERDQLAGALRHGGGAARRVADGRQLAEDLAWLDRADRLAAGEQADLAAEQQVDLAALEEALAFLLGEG